MSIERPSDPYAGWGGAEIGGAQEEHEDDPNDFADARYLMDDGEATLATCPVCRRSVCTCDDITGEPEHFRTYGHRRRGG